MPLAPSAIGTTQSGPPPVLTLKGASRRAAEPMAWSPSALPSLPSPARVSGSPAVGQPQSWQSSSEEAALIEALRRGEDAAFEHVVRTHTPRLFAVARRLLRSEADAQDALQQAFLLAFRALPRFQAQCRLSTWLHRIVTNTALMMLRSAGRRREDFADDIHADLLEEQPHTVTNPWPVSIEEEMTSRETRQQVRDAIDALPDRYRTVVMLRDVEGLSTEEAAAHLGLTANAAKVRLHRARQALMRSLEPVFGAGRTSARTGRLVSA